MRNNLRVGLAVAVLAGIGFWVLRDPGASYEPVADPKAYLQFVFEDDLASFSGGQVETVMQDGAAIFGSGPTGRTFYAQGDGSALEVTATDRANLPSVIEVAFDFKADDWTNPNTSSAPVRTMVVVSGRSGDKLRHLSFDLPANSGSAFRVSFEGTTGEKASIVSESGTVTDGWHSVRLVVDQDANTTELFLDGASVGTADVVPSVAVDGIDKLKVGTWFKQNQAFRGQIDNLIVRDATD